MDDGDTISLRQYSRILRHLTRPATTPALARECSEAASSALDELDKEATPDPIVTLALTVFSEAVLPVTASAAKLERILAKIEEEEEASDTSMRDAESLFRLVRNIFQEGVKRLSIKGLWAEYPPLLFDCSSRSADAEGFCGLLEVDVSVPAQVAYLDVTSSVRSSGKPTAYYDLGPGRTRGSDVLSMICKAQSVPEEHLLLVAVDLAQFTMISINPEMDLLWRVVGNGKVPIVYHLGSATASMEAALPASLLPVFHLLDGPGKRFGFPLLVRREKAWEDLLQLLSRLGGSAPAATKQISIAASVGPNAQRDPVRLRWEEPLPRDAVSLCLGWPNKHRTSCPPISFTFTLDQLFLLGAMQSHRCAHPSDVFCSAPVRERPLRDGSNDLLLALRSRGAHDDLHVLTGDRAGKAQSTWSISYAVLQSKGTLKALDSTACGKRQSLEGPCLLRMTRATTRAGSHDEKKPPSSTQQEGGRMVYDPLRLPVPTGKQRLPEDVQDCFSYLEHCEDLFEVARRAGLFVDI